MQLQEEVLYLKQRNKQQNLPKRHGLSVFCIEPNSTGMLTGTPTD